MATPLRLPPGIAESGDERATEYFFKSLYAMLTLTGTVTVDVAPISAGAVATFTIPVTGARVGRQQTVQLGPPSTLEAGLVWAGYVSADDVVTVRLHNTTGGAIDPASGTWGARVML